MTGQGTRRVAVTGLGVLSALGRDTREFWTSLVDGKSGIGPIESVDRDRLAFSNGAEIQGFDPAEHFDHSDVHLLDRFAQIGVAAAREAVRDAGVEWTDDLKRRTCLVTGSCLGGQLAEDRAFHRLYAENRERMHPLSIPRIMANAAASRISVEFGVTGPTFTCSTACSSATHAIGNAFWMVRGGISDMAITGGSESPFSMGNLKAWEALRVVSPDTCRPFSKDRRGMILGEAAAMLILEPLDRALARGAEVYCELVGFGMSADADHITKPNSRGPELAMHTALEDGGIAPEEVGYINAHGTGTRANDATETKAIRSLFGEHTARIAVSSTKSMHGHALGAAGAVESAATALTLKHGFFPPTANFTEPDPECDLEVVANEGRNGDAAYALSNSFAFGGLNAVLAFRRWEGSC